MSLEIRHGAFAAALAMILGATARAGEPTMTAGQESTVALSPSNGTMKVFLPSNYSADQKWPAIFFYHGMGGSPDTSLLRSFTVYQETCIKRLTDMKAVLDGYQKLAQSYPQTRYGKLSAQYAPHLADAYQKSVDATRKANEGRQTGGTTNTTSSVKPAFPVSGPGRPPIVLPVRKGNKITFTPP